MIDDPDAPQPFSLRRWSQRKLAVARSAATPAPPADATAVNASAAVADASAPVPAAAAGVTTGAGEPARDAPLPPVESLTIDSDFTAFLKPEVDSGVKRAALKKLFSDPRFNVMDGLDIYIGDYTQPDPMPAGMLAKLANVYGKLAKEGAPPEGALASSAADMGEADDEGVQAASAEPPAQVPPAASAGAPGVAAAAADSTDAATGIAADAANVIEHTTGVAAAADPTDAATGAATGAGAASDVTTEAADSTAIAARGRRNNAVPAGSRK